MSPMGKSRLVTDVRFTPETGVGCRVYKFNVLSTAPPRLRKQQTPCGNSLQREAPGPFLPSAWARHLHTFLNLVALSSV
jgi:hypothetical protein